MSSHGRLRYGPVDRQGACFICIYHFHSNHLCATRHHDEFPYEAETAYCGQPALLLDMIERSDFGCVDLQINRIANVEPPQF
jgi:hypothetical protein